MLWNFSNDRAIHAQLVEQIERLVLKGAYTLGARLPSVRELAEEAGVNPNTMQRALAELEQKGLLFTQSTNGRFVTQDEGHIGKIRESLAASITEVFLEDMLSIGLDKKEIESYLRGSKTSKNTIG